MTAAPEDADRWRPVMTVLLLALVAGFAALRARPPDPAPADAPATAFSATRARAVLERIAADSGPHGVGTPANAAMRERIAAELEALGLRVERQAAFSCRGIVCAPVVNLLAEVPGTDTEGPLVLVTSHYDSVHAGPGVADDLHGVAVGLELARALLAGTRPVHPVRLLFDEGEEVGLLGAAAFVDRHPDRDRVGVVINVEARGTRGLTSMFETSRGNRALVSTALAGVERPQATSLAAEVYARMPNDTDLSVFLRAGRPGLNFAFVGGVGHYHTPLDDLAHLDDGSVQHQGDTVLGAVRALAEAPLPLPATEDAIYADVLGLGVIAWPGSWAAGVPGVLLLGLGVIAWLGGRRGRVRLRRLALGPVAVLGTLVLTGAVAFGVAWLVATLQGETLPAHAEPLPLRLSLWLVALGVALASATVLGRFTRPLELALGVWLTWGGLALLLALTVPGASVALCLPVGGAVVGLGWALGGPRQERVGLGLAAVVLIALWTTLALGLEDVFGFAFVPVLVAPVAVIVTAIEPGLIAPRSSQKRLGAAVALATLVAIAGACLVPVYDADHPRRIAINHYDDRAQGEARLAVLAIDGLPRAVREAGQLNPEPGPVLPWTGRALHSGPALPGDEPPPQLAVVEGGAPGDPRHVRARLRSRRGADRAVLLLPPGEVREVWIEGRPVDTAANGRLLIFGLPAGGVILDLELRATAVDATVIDCKAGIPTSSEPVVAARDAASAVTVQWGDVGCIGTRVML